MQRYLYTALATAYGAASIALAVQVLMAAANPPPPAVFDAPPSYTTKEECISVTGRDCNFVMCDYVPDGKTFDEVCGRDFRKGWQASGN